jgi:hypothetical protein
MATFSKDDGPRAGITLEKRSAHGRPSSSSMTAASTAGDAYPLNGGGAALVMSSCRATELGLKPHAKVIAASAARAETEYMDIDPVPATTQSNSAPTTGTLLIQTSALDPFQLTVVDRLLRKPWTGIPQPGFTFRGENRAWMVYTSCGGAK